MHFGVTNQFSGILKFLRFFWSDLVSAIGFLEAVNINYLLISSRNDFKGSLNAIIIFNLVSITFSVKQKEDAVANP